MNKLALKLPGFDALASPVPSLKPEFKDLASLISPVLDIIFYVAMFLAFFWLVWGAFAYILAQGNKENLAKARARLSWAIIGLMVVLLAFFIAKFVSEIFGPKGGLPF